MKPFLPFIGIYIMTLGLTPSARSQTMADPAANKEAACDQALFSAIGGLADAHLLQTIEILARTEEVRSGQWERMKRLVCGDLAVSKSTGKKSVIIAVPVTRENRVMGGIGASIFADDLSRLLNDRLNLPAGSLFYALTIWGMTAFHINPMLDFVDPWQQQKPLAERRGEDDSGSNDRRSDK